MACEIMWEQKHSQNTAQKKKKLGISQEILNDTSATLLFVMTCNFMLAIKLTAESFRYLNKDHDSVPFDSVHLASHVHVMSPGSAAELGGIIAC